MMDEKPVQTVQTQPTCSVCNENESKYQCPACGCRTCSLKCFKAHKAQANCPGKSDITLNKTRYLPKDKLDNLDVQRDYNFLMKVDRKIGIGKREWDSNRILTARKRVARQGRGRRQLENRRFDDEDKIIMRNGVRIRQLPVGMSRNSKNKSGFDRRKGKFMWTVEWVLMDGNFKTLDTYTGFKNDEHGLLQKIVPSRKFTKTLGEEDESEDAGKRFYFFVESEDEKNMLVRIPGDTPLAEAIEGKLFIEFPTIYVSTEPTFHHLGRKRVVSMNEEDESSSSSSSSGSSDSSSGSESESESESSDSGPEEASAKINEDLPLAKEASDDDDDYDPSANFIP